MGDLLLDGVVCVVDSRNVLKVCSWTTKTDRKQLEEDKGGEVNECQKQVACADVILLNKADLVTAQQMTDVEQTVK
jgi:G3E family GTPase